MTHASLAVIDRPRGRGPAADHAPWWLVRREIDGWVQCRHCKDQLFPTFAQDRRSGLWVPLDPKLEVDPWPDGHQTIRHKPCGLPVTVIKGPLELVRPLSRDPR